MRVTSLFALSELLLQERKITRGRKCRQAIAAPFRAVKNVSPQVLEYTGTLYCLKFLPARDERLLKEEKKKKEGGNVLARCSFTEHFWRK